MAHPVRNFFVIVGLIVGSALIVNFAADLLQQAQLEKRSSAPATSALAATP